MTEGTENTSVKIDKEIWRKAKIICIERDQSLVEYVSDLLRPLVDSEYPKALAELAAEEGLSGAGLIS